MWSFFLLGRRLVRRVHVLIEVLGSLARGMARVLLEIELLQVFELIVATDLHLADIAEVHLVSSAHALFAVILLLGWEVEIEFLEGRLALSLWQLDGSLCRSQCLV